MDTEKKYRTQEETEIIYHELAKKWGINEDDIERFESDMFRGDSNKRPHPVLVSIVNDLKENIDWWIENHQETLSEKRLKNINPRKARRKTGPEKKEDIHQELMQEFGFTREQIEIVIKENNDRHNVCFRMMGGIVRSSRIWGTDYKKELLNTIDRSTNELLSSLVEKRRAFLTQEINRVYQDKPNFIDSIVKNICPHLDGHKISLVTLTEIYEETVKSLPKENLCVVVPTNLNTTLQKDDLAKERLLTLLTQFKNNNKTIYLKIYNQETDFCCNIVSISSDEKTGLILVDIVDVETEDVKKRKTIIFDEIEKVKTYNLDKKFILVDVKELGSLDFTDMYNSFISQDLPENTKFYGESWIDLIEDEPSYRYKKLAEKHSMTPEEIYKAEEYMIQEKLSTRERGVLSFLFSIDKKIKAIDEWVTKRKSPYQ